MNETLLDAFRNTDYLVCLDEAEWACIHIDQALPEALLRRIQQQSWGFLTAWNPGAQKRATDDNHAAQRELLQTLRQWPGAMIYPAIGIGPHWHEPSLFVIGPDIAYMDTLAQRQQQIAYVCGCSGDVARLRLL